MSSMIVSGGIAAAAVLATALAGYTVTMSQEQSDEAQQVGYTINMTQDIQNCQLEMVADAAFTRGIYTQGSASAAVSDCMVSEGTVLAVQVNSNSRDYSITATNAGAPNYIVVSDTAAGGAVNTIAK
jgi:hypothetical protein